MENEIDDDELAAMLADDDEQEEQQIKNEDKKRKLTFVEQAETMTKEQLVALACSLIDTTSSTNTNDSIVNISNIDTERSSSKKLQSSTLSIDESKTQSTITPTVYMEPTTHIRIGTLNYTPTEIKTKLTSTKFIRLSDIDKQLPPMPKEWCTMAVLASKSDVKQASNGSTYSIWRITDFKTTMNMFLFGDAHQTLWKTVLSSVLLVYDGDTKKSGQLSIKSERNLCILGSNPDLGQCKAKTKSGDQCKVLVDRHSCEYCVTHARQVPKTKGNNKYNHGHMSRMNLQSTGAYVPKKFAAIGSTNDYMSSLSSSSWSNNSTKSTSKKSNQSSKTNTDELTNKEKSMLVILGLEDEQLVCVRSQDTKGLGDSIDDIRQIYQAKQAIGKKKRTDYDETKDRDKDDTSTHIRSFPLSASISLSASDKTSPIKDINSVSIKKKVDSAKQFVDLTTSASSEAISSAKQRAIEILKQRLAQKQIPQINGESSDMKMASPKRQNTDFDMNESTKRVKLF